MITLTEDEKQKIVLAEEYRQEVRHWLERRGLQYWFEKLIAPTALVLITAFVTGLVIPYILRVDDDQRRSIELKSKFIGDVVTENAAAQMAMIRYNEQLCDYWNAAISLEARKRTARLMPPGPERDSEYDAISMARKHEYEIRLDVDRQYADSRVRLAIALDRLRSAIALYYGDAKPLKQYADAVEKEAAAADELLNAVHQDTLSKLFIRVKTGLKTCPNDSACEKVAADATEEVEKVRDESPQFTEWRKAAHDLSAYIVDRQPAIGGSRKVLASALGATK